MTGRGTGRRVRGLDAAQRREQRRSDLISAALTLFAERGFLHVSIEELCQTAFVGTKSFYELFDNKEQCYLALFEGLAARLLGDMAEAQSRFGADNDRLIAAFVHRLTEDPRVPSVLFRRSTAVSPAVEAARRANRRSAATLVVHAWSAADPPESFGVAELTSVALGFVGGMFELITDWLHEHDPSVPADVARLVEDLTRFHATVRRGLDTP